MEIIERQTESQERLAIQLEQKIKYVEKYSDEQHSLIKEVEQTAHRQVEEMGSELQEYVNNSREDLQNIRKYHSFLQISLYISKYLIYSIFQFPITFIHTFTF